MLSDWLKKPGAACATNQMKAEYKLRLGRTHFPALCFLSSLVPYVFCVVVCFRFGFRNSHLNNVFVFLVQTIVC